MRGRVLIIGTGGREHALAWRLSRDPEAGAAWVAPGNPGMAQHQPCVALDPGDDAEIARFVSSQGVSLVVIGPEQPLADGLADRLEARGIRTFGPSAAAARLESSKWFAKQVMAAAGVRTARAERFERLADALAALEQHGPPWVIKADALAAGKGVLVTSTRAEAERFVGEVLSAAPGAALVLEEFLAGEEASVMAVCDGVDTVLLPAARDYKRAFDGDLGPNTGGMGSYAPAPSVTAEIEAEVAARIVRPVLREMASRGTPFRGLLYVGLMIGPAGLSVVEFNARFGDPETQSILPLVGGDLGRLLESAAEGRLDPASVSRLPGAAVTVALVDEAYPGNPRGPGRIDNVDSLAGAGVEVFHARTWPDGSGWALRGGRAAYVTALDVSIAAARARAFAAIGKLTGGGWRCRHDIAAPVLGLGVVAS